MTLPIPTLDPSTDAGWRAWDIYLREQDIAHRRERFVWEQAVNTARYEQTEREIAARVAIATAEAGMAQGQQASATAAIRQADAMVEYSRNLLASTAFSPEVAAEIIRIAQEQAPDDWINRSVSALGQYRTAFAGFFP
jgi:hypothetical protein